MRDQSTIHRLTTGAVIKIGKPPHLVRLTCVAGDADIRISGPQPHRSTDRHARRNLADQPRPPSPALLARVDQRVAELHDTAASVEPADLFEQTLATCAAETAKRPTTNRNVLALANLLELWAVAQYCAARFHQDTTP
jgi:hypothetical protein